MTEPMVTARTALPTLWASVQRVLGGGLARNSAWLMADKVLRLLGGLVVGALVARHLGPDAYGLLNATLATVGLLLALAGMGLDLVTVRALASAEHAPGAILGTVLALKLSAGITAAVLLVALSVGATGAGVPALLAIISAPTLVWSAFDVFDYWSQSQGRFGLLATCRAIAYASALALRLGLLGAAAPVEAFAAAAMLEVLLGGVILAVAVARQPQHPVGWRVELDVARGLLRQSAPMWLSAIAVWAYLRVDQLMIANLLAPADLGRYAAAVRLAESWYFVPTAIVTASFPGLVQLRTRSLEQYRAGTERLFRLLAGIGCAAGLAATLLAPLIVGVLFGPDYVEATPAFQVLAWSGWFAAWGVARDNWLVAEGLTRYSPITTAIGGVLNVGLNLLLLPHYGILAAAWTTLLAQFVVVSLSLVLWPETRPVLRMQIAALAFWRKTG